jgi:type IV pilus assembly protein PilW
MKRAALPRRGRQSGFTLVEVAIGAAVALFLLGGTLKLFGSQIATHRRVLLEARVHQDLRSAGDLIARDLRRAAHWRAAVQGTVWPARPNPYRAISADSGGVTYSYTRDDVENGSIDSNERFGFRLVGGALQALNGDGGWQQVTDPGTVLLTRLAITPSVRSVSLGHLCTPACDAAQPACPSLRIRQFEVQIEGRAAKDAAIARQLRDAVRVRNDEMSTGACP